MTALIYQVEQLPTEQAIKIPGRVRTQFRFKVKEKIKGILIEKAMKKKHSIIWAEESRSTYSGGQINKTHFMDFHFFINDPDHNKYFFAYK